MPYIRLINKKPIEQYDTNIYDTDQRYLKDASVDEMKEYFDLLVNERIHCRLPNKVMLLADMVYSDPLLYSNLGRHSFSRRLFLLRGFASANSYRFGLVRYGRRFAHLTILNQNGREVIDVTGDSDDDDEQPGNVSEEL